MSETLQSVDLAVIAVYIVGVVVFGSYFMGRSKTLEGFTVGSRSLPGWAVGLSILGTYVSSISFLANPGKSYLGNWTPFVFGLGLPIACWIASRYFIPLYRDKLQTTAYEHLEGRFGYWARAYSGISLVLLQIGRIGVVLYLISLAMSEFVPLTVPQLILVLGILTILYTVLGGIEAVIWTDVVQTIVLLGGGVACCVLLLMKVPEGGLQQAWDAGKFDFGGWDFNLAKEAFWVVFIFGIVDNLRNFSVDQNYVQRFLAAESEREARKSVWLGGLSYLPVSALFFLIGTLLYLFYQAQPPAALPTEADKVFPFFIVNTLPVGVRGLVIAALLAAGMSTLDSSINASATVFTVDFYKRFFKADDARLLWITRGTTVVVGVIGMGTSLFMIKEKSVLDAWWKISGVFGGGMLGIFFLGLMVPRASRRHAIVAVIAGVVVIAWGTFCRGEDAAVRFPFHPFMIGPCGTLTIVLVGWLASKLFDDPRADA